MPLQQPPKRSPVSPDCAFILHPLQGTGNIFLKGKSHRITLWAWPSLRPARCSGHKIEGTHPRWHQRGVLTSL